MNLSLPSWHRYASSKMESNHNAQLSGKRSRFKYFNFDDGVDTPNGARNILLLVATLIAAVTFSAGVSPPGGVWQDNKNGHRAGTAIYASQKYPFYVFLISNTVALSTSIFLILFLTYKFPFHLEIIVATISMITTYASAIFAVTPDEAYRSRYVLTAAAVPFLLRCFIQGYHTIRRKFPD